MRYYIADETKVRKEYEAIRAKAVELGFKVTCRNKNLFRIYSKRGFDSWTIYCLLAKQFQNVKGGPYGDYLQFEWPKHVDSSLKHILPDGVFINQNIYNI